MFIVFIVALMSLSGLYSAMTIWVYGIFTGGGINLVSLFCMGLKCVLMMFS